MIDFNIISAEELYNSLKKDEKIQIIDVRENVQDIVSIKNAIHIPASQLIKNQEGISHDKKIVLYCWQGVDSFFLMNFLINNGYEKVFSLKSGLESWHNLLKNKILDFP